jgi:putative photosynthetic complex assembly protein
MSHSHPHHDPTVPRSALIGVGVLLLGVLGMTGAVSLGWLPHSANPSASRAKANVALAQERLIRFADRADGAVVVTDVDSGEVIKVIAFGQGGFLRATMRRMAKARLAKNIGAEPPFRLVRWENGALSLIDPSTGREAEIFGFGPDQTKTFADMLKDPAA